MMRRDDQRDKLKSLIEDWRDRAENTDKNIAGNTEYRVLHECADELADVINNER